MSAPTDNARIMSSSPLMDTSDAVERLVGRRAAILHGAAAGSSAIAALAMGSIPVALVALARNAYAQAPSSVVGVLEFAYLLENLEAEFYKAVLGESATAAQNTAFAPVRAQVQNDPEVFASLQQIRKHEVSHVGFLKAQITALGGSAPTYTGAEFDFTGGNGSGNGPFALAKSDPAILLAAAQLLEDTGVRAYKGQVDQLMSNKDVLTAVLRIHSVEARHAARIRRLRNVTGLKPWISSSSSETTTGVTFGPGTSSSASLSATTTGYARTSGSFLTDGFAAGQRVRASGFTNPANNGESTVTAVTATALTVSKTPGTVAEPAATGRSVITATAIPPAGNSIVAAAYAGENNTRQGGINMSGLGSNTGGTEGVTEAFDEPLTHSEVISVIGDFVIDATP